MTLPTKKVDGTVPEVVKPTTSVLEPERSKVPTRGADSQPGFTNVQDSVYRQTSGGGGGDDGSSPPTPPRRPHKTPRREEPDQPAVITAVNRDEANFLKEVKGYNGQVPFETYMKKFDHLAILFGVRPPVYKAALYTKMQGPPSALIIDMAPSDSDYLGLSGKSYARAVGERLEPVTEKKLIYQQFLNRIQQHGESVDLYVLDKHNLFLRGTKTETRNFDDCVEYTIRGLTNEYLKRKVRERSALTDHTPKTFVTLRGLINSMVTLVQSRLQSGELDATEGVGCEVHLYSYSYMDLTKETDHSRFHVKEEKVNSIPELPEGINYVPEGTRPNSGFRNRPGFQSRFTDSFRSRGRRVPQSTSGRSQQSKLAPDSDVCFYCNQTGHWLNSCPRRLNGFPKAVNTVGEVYNSEPDDQEEDEVAALSARVDRLFNYMAEKSGKSGKSVYPLKEDPQQSKGDGAVHFLG